jgi:hypothetical protein
VVELTVGSGRPISMTTEALRATYATLLRGRCDPATSVRAGVVTGIAGFVVVASTSLLYFVNLYGPFAERAGLGGLAGLGCGVLSGAVVFTLTWWAARRSRLVLIVLLGVLGAAGWVLMPRQIDVLESWVNQPNPRWSCTGWSFPHYPPGTFDYHTSIYCVGLEERIADG